MLSVIVFQRNGSSGFLLQLRHRGHCTKSSAGFPFQSGSASGHPVTSYIFTATRNVVPTPYQINHLDNVSFNDPFKLYNAAINNNS
ncbi:hypothetical protein [Foetidibacter luteolus]|uniref:hypothetical protein n=1 Tax=Foetidibacter luteolus TaxID=2608880 RepID=UPI00129B69A7|nr:hypothetical protein [Foetidibacter luteolus]